MNKRFAQLAAAAGLLTLTASLAVLACCGWLPADEALNPQRGVVLLANGRTLEGRVIRDGDWYIVGLAGGEIRLNSADVQAVCRDYAECYLCLRRKHEHGNADDHLNLALWCLHYELAEQAAAELRLAEGVNPRHPRLPLVQRRLEALRQAASKSLREGESAAPQTASKSPSLGASPHGDGMVTPEILDRFTEQLPPGVVERFTAAIQPILQNNCTAAKCHGPQSETGLRLQRVVHGRFGSRRITQRNLYSVMQYVDRERPLKSKLLLTTLQPHGGMKQPVFTTHEAVQYQQLYHWVRAAAGKHGDAEAAGPKDVLAQPAQALAPDVKKTDSLPAAGRDDDSTLPTPARAELERRTKLAELPREDAARLKPGTAEEAEVKTEHASERKPREPALFAPQDPFDPEIFNRKYFGR